MEVEGIDLAETNISALKRPILQRICKALGIKAVGKNKDLVHKLEDHIRVHAPTSPAKRRSASNKSKEEDEFDELKVAGLSLNDKQIKHESSSISSPVVSVNPLQEVKLKNGEANATKHGSIDENDVATKCTPSSFYYPFEAVAAAKTDSRFRTPIRSPGKIKEAVGKKENCSSPSQPEKENVRDSKTSGTNSSKSMSFRTTSSKPKTPYRSPRIEVICTPIRKTPQRCRNVVDEAKKTEDDNEDGVVFHDASDSLNDLDQEVANRLKIATEQDAHNPSLRSSPSPVSEVFVDAMTPGILLRSTPFPGLVTAGIIPKPIFKFPSSQINKPDAINENATNLKAFEFPFGADRTNFFAKTPKPPSTAKAILDSRAPYTTGKQVQNVTLATAPPGRRIAQPHSKSKSPLSTMISVPAVDGSLGPSVSSGTVIFGISNEEFGNATKTILKEMADRVLDTMKLPENERTKLFPNIFKSTEKVHPPRTIRKIGFDNIHRKNFLGLDSISNHYAAKRTARLKSSRTTPASGAASNDGNLDRNAVDANESATEVTEKNKRRSEERFMSVGVKKIRLERTSSKEVSVNQKSPASKSTTKVDACVKISQSPQSKVAASPNTSNKTTPGKSDSTRRKSYSPFNARKTPSKSTASPLLQKTLIRMAVLKSAGRAKELPKVEVNQRNKEDTGTDNKLVGSTPAQKVIANSTYVTDTVRKVSKVTPPGTAIRNPPRSVLPAISPLLKADRRHEISTESLAATKKILSSAFGDKEKEKEMLVEQLKVTSVNSGTEALRSTLAVRPKEVKDEQNKIDTSNKDSGKSTKNEILAVNVSPSASKSLARGKSISFERPLSNSLSQVQSSLVEKRSVASVSHGALGTRKNLYALAGVKKPQEKVAAPITPKPKYAEESAVSTSDERKTFEPGFLRSTKASILKCQRPTNSPGPIINQSQSMNLSIMSTPSVTGNKTASASSHVIQPGVTTRVTRSKIPSRAKKDDSAAKTSGKLQQTSKPMTSRAHKPVEPREHSTTDGSTEKLDKSPVAMKRKKFDIAASLARPLPYRPHTGRLAVVPPPKSLATGEADAAKQRPALTEVDGDEQGKKRAPARAKAVPKQQVSEKDSLQLVSRNNNPRSVTKASKEGSEKSRKSAAPAAVSPKTTENKSGRGYAMSTRSRAAGVGSEKENRTTRAPVAESGKTSDVPRSLLSARAK